MNPRPATLASAYTAASLTTASPQKLVVLLYERLDLDLARAEEALRAGRGAHAQLVHAQDIVMELLGSLKPELWDGATSLASVYTYLHTQLVTANVRRDADLVVTCRELVAPLLDAWRQALEEVTAPARVAPATASALAASAAAGAVGAAVADVRRVPLSVTA